MENNNRQGDFTYGGDPANAQGNAGREESQSGAEREDHTLSQDDVSSRMFRDPSDHDDPWSAAQNGAGANASSVPFSDAPTQQAAGQPYGNPVQQPVGQPYGSPVQQPTGQPYGGPAQQPVGQPYGGPVQQPAGQPYGSPVQQPTGQPYDGPAQQPIGQPYGAPVQQPTGQVYGGPAQQPVGQPYGGIQTPAPVNAPAKKKKSPVPIIVAVVGVIAVAVVASLIGRSAGKKFASEWDNGSKTDTNQSQSTETTRYFALTNVPRAVTVRELTIYLPEEYEEFKEGNEEFEATYLSDDAGVLFFRDDSVADVADEWSLERYGEAFVEMKDCGPLQTASNGVTYTEVTQSENGELVTYLVAFYKASNGVFWRVAFFTFEKDYAGMKADFLLRAGTVMV